MKRKVKFLNPTFSLVLLYMILLAILRIGSAFPSGVLMSDFSPLGAMAIFGGCYFYPKWKGLLFPIGILFFSDIIIMHTAFAKFNNGNVLYSGWYWTYAAFLLMAFLGSLIRRVSFLSVAATALVISLLHYIITDFGAWMSGCPDITTGRPYSKDLQGLIKCYILALPFLRNFLVSTILYSGLLFGSFEFLVNHYPSLGKNLRMERALRKPKF